MRKTATLLAAMICITSSFNSFGMCVDNTYATDGFNTNVKIDVSGKKTNISPYIYGINDGCSPDDVTSTAMRQGGNRYTAYNWETNYSNAGEDWLNSSDTYLSASTTPGQCGLDLSEKAKKYGAEYTLATLQMAGYVSADADGTVKEDEAAPSSRWNKVEFRKNAPFSDTPDLTDGVVYMDEYVNYLVSHLGDSQNGGITAYSLDNEPALWSNTHKLMHPEQVSCDELLKKSIELSESVKAIDKNAEIFGPALYGFSAYMNLQSAPDWDDAKNNKYGWYISYYLDKMAEAEKSKGTRLLDVLDLHYYSSDAGSCDNNVCNCNDNTHTDCIEARLQSVRTLWDDTYTENSWIGQWFKSNLPIIPKVKASIDEYYPGTKLAFTEYNFGGGTHVSGAIAEADALGIFGQQEVYFATLWPMGDTEYMYSGINLYTNYDGKGNSFGDVSIPVASDNQELCTAYASLDSTDGNKSDVHCVLTNKSLTENETAEIILEGASTDYKSATVYAVTQDSSKIKVIDVQNNISSNKITVELPALSVAHVVISGNSSDADITVDPEITEKKVEFKFSDLEKSKDGYLIPIEDAANLKKAVINTTASCSSDPNSWYGGGGGLCFDNLRLADGSTVWANKSFMYGAGTSNTEVVFNGKFTTPDDDKGSIEVEGEITDKYMELQDWWKSSKADETGADVTVTYNSITLYYEYVDTGIAGDINGDGEFNMADVVLLQRWLLAEDVKISGWKNADFCSDGRLDVFDMCLMRKAVISK